MSSRALVIEGPVSLVTRSPPITASVLDTAITVVYRMVTYAIGAVIIENQGIPVGIITERDIVEKVVHANRDASRTFAGDIMSSPLISIDEEQPVSEALRLMDERDIRRLAVTRAGNLVGIVTERRLLGSVVWQ